jgi:hypothetical protein
LTEGQRIARRALRVAGVQRLDHAHAGNRRGDDDSTSAQQSASIDVTIVHAWLV